MCSTSYEQLGVVVAQLPSMEQLFTPPGVGLGHLKNQPAITQGLQYVRGQVEAGVSGFTQWRAQVMAQREQGSGELTESCWGVTRNQRHGCFVSSEEQPGSCSEVSAELEEIINTVLCGVQALVKKNAERKQLNRLQGANGESLDKVLGPVQALM